MPANAAVLMFVPWLTSPTSAICASGTALTAPSAPAMIFNVYQDERQLQNAAVKLTNLALATAKESSCVGECRASEKGSMTHTAFC